MGADTGGTRPTGESAEDIGMTNRATPDRCDPAVVANYFATMRHFLRTQGRVMSAWAGRDSGARVHASAETLPVAKSNTRRLAAASIAPANAGPTAPAVVSPAPAPIAPAIRNESAPPAVVAITPANAPLGDLRETLLEIVEEKTGYPRDMVGFDRNLETDLGIDSIKRIEIVGTLLQHLPENTRARLVEVRTRLNTQSTLGGILEIIRAAQTNHGEPPDVVAPVERIPAIAENVI